MLLLLLLWLLVEFFQCERTALKEIVRDALVKHAELGMLLLTFL